MTPWTAPGHYRYTEKNLYKSYTYEGRADER